MEAGLGKIRLFNDFAGVGDAVALTAASNEMGDFYVGGLNIVDADGGIGANVSLLGGTVTIQSANVDLDTAFIGTSGLGFNVGLMGLASGSKPYGTQMPRRLPLQLNSLFSKRATLQEVSLFTKYLRCSQRCQELGEFVKTQRSGHNCCDPV